MKEKNDLKNLKICFGKQFLFVNNGRRVGQTTSVTRFFSEKSTKIFQKEPKK
jgi:hypothetical protein